MTRETYRTIGALIGLSVGIGLTIALGYSGQLLPSAVFAAAGCVAGGMLAERMHDSKGD